MSKYDEIEKIFGVKNCSASDIEGMERLYVSEHGDASDPKYVRQMVLRDKAGSYFLAIKGGSNAARTDSLFYPIAGRDILIPITQGCLYAWALHNLSYEEVNTDAINEFKPKDSPYRAVWRYYGEVEPGNPVHMYTADLGHLFEVLLKTDSGEYRLFSTNPCYPYFCGQTMWLGEGTPYNGEGYTFDIPKETARRWAETRDMDADTYQALFDD